MTYELKGGEEIREGILYGWTGVKCSACDGHGVDDDDDDDEYRRCLVCGGTGEAWGVMPHQPEDLNT